MTNPHRAPALSDPIIEIGHVVGEKYRVEAVIGSGGMGVVVAARHIAMNNRVAIKVLKIEETDDRQEALSRFQREARAAARIESDHVVRVTDVAALPDGTPYMVMEYLEGDDLRRVIQERHQLPIEEAVDYVIQACEGLAEAHAAGVIHRDLKPSNLFLARRPNGTTVVKVLDFGISKLVPRAGEVAMTTTNSLMGSPLYMAPEQMRSSRDVDARADVWSLGLILYELLAGDLPFGGATIPEICVAVMNAEPEAISRHRTDVPQELQAILLKCLAKSRDERYPSTAALARDLAAFASDRARVHADRASAALKASRSVVETLPDLPAKPPPSRPDPETQPSWTARREGQGAGRRRPAWIAAGVVLASACALGVVAIVRAPGAAPAPRAPEVPSTPAAAATRASETPASPGDSIASVPFDSLPVAAHDAGAARAVRAPSLPPSHALATPPASASPPPAKDDWKWGDRN